MDIHFKRKDEPLKSFIPFVKQLINESNNRTNYKTGKKISVHTIKKYRTTLNHLQDFIIKTRYKVDFENINTIFYEEYKKFLMNEYKLSVNSIGKDFSVIKFFLNEATERGINNNLSFKSSRFKTISEVSDTIYLNEQELKLLFDLDLTESKTYSGVRDLFLIGCFTGLRYSDYSVLTKENIIDGKIRITTYKTGEPVVIPIHPIVKAIFEKRNYELPKSLSNQKTNQYLKEIAAEIDELQVLVNKKITKGGVREVQYLKKYEMVTTHTARRSFATNLYLSNFPSISIMKITGHRTESAFMRYIKITPDDNANALEAHWNKAV